MEITQIGKSLFKEIGMLMKKHTECIFLLTSDSNHHSEMNCPTKKDGKILLHININFDDVNYEKFIYICQKETDFLLILTNHPALVILGHELGHLIRTLLKIDQAILNSTEDQWSDIWNKLYFNEYCEKLQNVSLKVLSKICAKFADFKYKPISEFIIPSVLSQTISNYIDKIIPTLSNKLPYNFEDFLRYLHQTLDFDVNIIRNGL